MISDTLQIPIIKVILGIVIMMVVTYICRVITFVCFRKKIKNTFIKSLITYIPYGILAAMVFPEIIFSTQNGEIFSYAIFIATIIGTITAITLSLLKQGLFVVSMSSVGIVLLLIFIFNTCGIV